MKPEILIITGYGVNCEAESRFAWEQAGAKVTLLHLNDLLDNPAELHKYQGLMFIGGFSYGDHMGSGLVFAQRLKHRLQEDLQRFIDDEKIMLGVCNGFQVMTKIGLVPGFDNAYFDQKIALMQNDCGTFQDFWITMEFDQDSPCIFTKGIGKMDLPIRHGEGKLFTLDKELLARIDAAHQIPCRYIDPVTGAPAMKHPANPNGSLLSMAGLCDPTGRVFGLMPHPEAFLYPENHPQYDSRRINGDVAQNGDGLKLFQNGVDYLKS